MSNTRRPLHLWVVGILALLWNVVGAMDYLLTQTENESYLSQLTQEQIDFFTNFPSWVIASWAVAVWGGVAASILLLLRKKAAFAVFVISFAGMIVTSFHNFVLSDGVRIMSGAGTLAFAVLIIVIAALLPVYVRRQTLSGQLN